MEKKTRWQYLWTIDCSRRGEQRGWREDPYSVSPVFPHFLASPAAVLVFITRLSDHNAPWQPSLHSHGLYGASSVAAGESPNCLFPLKPSNTLDTRNSAAGMWDDSSIVNAEQPVAISEYVLCDTPPTLLVLFHAEPAAIPEIQLHGRLFQWAWLCMDSITNWAQKCHVYSSFLN